MTESKLEEELKHLIDEKWQWKVKKIAERDFLAVFPNKILLDAFSKSAGFKIALYNTWATMSPSTRDPFASSVLQTGWVQLFNVPDWARCVEVVTLIGELAGNVIIVDELSLIKEEPIRVKIQARDIDKVRGLVEIFIDGVGYDIKFIPEKTKPQPSKPPPLPPRPDDGDSDEDDEDLLGSEEDTPRGSFNNGDRGRSSGQKQMGSDSAIKQSGGNSTSKQSASSINQRTHKTPTSELELDQHKDKLLEAKPIAMFDQKVGKFIDFASFLGNANTITNEGEILQEEIPSHGKRSQEKEDTDSNAEIITVHCEGGGSKQIRKDQWPILKLRVEIETTIQAPTDAAALEIVPSQESMDLEVVDEENMKILPEQTGGATRQETAMTEDYISDDGRTVTEDDRGDWKLAGNTKQKSNKKRRFYPAVAA